MGFLSGWWAGGDLGRFSRRGKCRKRGRHGHNSERVNTALYLPVAPSRSSTCSLLPRLHMLREPPLVDWLAWQHLFFIFFLAPRDLQPRQVPTSTRSAPAPPTILCRWPQQPLRHLRIATLSVFKQSRSGGHRLHLSTATIRSGVLWATNRRERKKSSSSRNRKHSKWHRYVLETVDAIRRSHTYHLGTQDSGSDSAFPQANERETPCPPSRSQSPEFAEEQLTGQFDGPADGNSSSSDSDFDTSLDDLLAQKAVRISIEFQRLPS